MVPFILILAALSLGVGCGVRKDPIPYVDVQREAARANAQPAPVATPAAQPKAGSKK